MKTDWSILKLDLGKLDIGKLKTVPSNLSKLNEIVDNDVSKKTVVEIKEWWWNGY